ncbi:alpha/beta hydrolase family protein [Chloroflexota bacterium]
MKRVPRITSTIDGQHGRTPLRRDTQQWVYDYLIQQTNKTYHWMGDGPGNLPKSVRSHAMISKHLGRQAQLVEVFAETELAAGHRESALELYFDAAHLFSRAQHPIFELNEEKKFLYAGLRRCYDQVCALSPYRIEKVEVPWNGTLLTGFLHHCPGVAKAPLLLKLGGCDVTQETDPHPSSNLAHRRGMHLFTLDGPGQGQSNMRGIRLTGDNFAPATSAVLDYLTKRPEIDADRIGMLGNGGGSIWGMRVIAEDHRIKAAATSSTYTDPFHWMDVEVPRWKQLFAFLTQSTSEQELDKVMEAMQVSGHMSKITCPTLMVSGEYDLRDPIEEVYRVFDELKVPAELWVFADQFHLTSLAAGGTEMVHALMIDWVKDRLEGKPVAHPGQVLYLDKNGAGPNSPTVPVKRRWYERATQK